jgi:uncharacterized membrane protein
MITEIAVSFSVPQKFLQIIRMMLLFQISYGCYIVYLRKSKIKLAKLRVKLPYFYEFGKLCVAVQYIIKYDKFNNMLTYILLY